MKKELEGLDSFQMTIFTPKHRILLECDKNVEAIQIWYLKRKDSTETMQSETSESVSCNLL